jgi:hypothetical protein
VENEHNFKGTRALLLLLRFIIATGELIAIYVIMKKVESVDVLTEWIKTCVAMTIIYILVLDTLLCAIYGLILGRARITGIETFGQAFFSGILAGNGDYRARLNACLEMNC